MLKKFLNLFTFFLLISLCFQSLAQQKKGAYRPTKFDSVKKVIPKQYYGNAKEARRADSIANAVAEQKALELKEQEEIARQKSRGNKRKKKKVEPIIEQKKVVEEKPAVEPKVKEVVKQRVTPQKIERAKILPQAPKVLAKPVPVVKKSNPKFEKLKNEAWTLADCIAYAKLNDLKIAQSTLNERYAKLLYEESKNSRYPDLNGDIRVGKAFGRNIDPATNQFVNNNFTYNTAGFQSQILLFGWFQKKFQVEKDKLSLEAAKFENQQIEEDVSLNIAAGFIRLLQAKELVTLMEQMLKSGKKQLDLSNSNLKEEYGSKLFLVSDQVADSAQYIGAKATEKIALLQLKALLNFDFNENFSIQTTENDAAQIAQYFSLPDVDELYLTALQNKGVVQFQQSRLYAANKSLDIAKASQYPQLIMFGGFGTVFSSNIKNITSQTYLGESTNGYVNIEGSSYPISTSNYSYTTQTRSLSSQYVDHLRANIGIGISVPLLNGYSSRASIQKAKIALVSEQINMDSEKQKLKQEIYVTSEEVKAALQLYMAYQKASDKSQKLVETVGSQGKAEKGDRALIREAAKNHIFNQSSAIQAKYELYFKLKKLDYFVGNPIKM